jgi:hypothetical protein
MLPPFLVWRVDSALARPDSKPMSFGDILRNYVSVATSGNFSNPALLCCMQVDRAHEPVTSVCA